MFALVHTGLRPTRGPSKSLSGGDNGDNDDHYEDWCDEDDYSSAQEKDLILSSRSFDPVKSQKLLSGNIFLLLRDMLKNK